MQKFPNVKTETEVFPCLGGLDLVSPALMIKPGRLIACRNYVPDLNGGYRLYGMYERFDGRTRPSEAVYVAVACTLTSTPALGSTVTIGAATGLFAGTVDGGCILTGVVGTIPVSTQMTVLGSPVGTTAANLNLQSPTTRQDAERTLAASNTYRTLIQPVPGSGPIRGVVQYQALTYAFRDNVGATACVMHVSSPTGWTAVDLGEEILFTNANTNVGDNDVLTQGGATATIRRVIVETGSLLSGTNTGRLIISGRTGGNFAAGAATSTGSGTLTLSGAQTANVLPPGGRYEFDIANFTGGLTTSRVYGVNGVGRAFEFDGTTFAFIRTGSPADTPKYIKAHRRYLYLAIGASFINSSVGNPFRFVTAEGASEVAVGDTITGFASLPGEALGIMCRNSSFQLTGASATTWSLGVLRSDVGAVPYTVQTMGDTFMMDDRGITSVVASEDYGNFTSITVSTDIQPLVDQARGQVVGSYLSRRLGLYAIILDTGKAIVMCAKGRSLLGFTELQLEFTPTCASSGEDLTGVERIWVGSSDGYVYEMERGQSADGDDLEAFLRISYNQSRSPRARKRYRRCIMQFAVQQYTTMRLSTVYSFGDQATRGFVLGEAIQTDAIGGFWDQSQWDEFYWEGRDVFDANLSLDGTGTNISITLYKNNALDIGHIVQGGIIHFTPRRIER